MSDVSVAPKTQALQLIGALTAVAISGAIMWYRRKPAVIAKKLHVNFATLPKLPLIVRLITHLPPGIRRKMALALQKPKPPLDGVDVLGEDYDPYKEIRELIPGKLWRVRYKYLADPVIYEALKDLYGVDMSDHAAIMENIPSMKRAKVQACIDALTDMERANQGLDVKQQQENKIKIGYEESQDMLVARLENCNDGGLLLYNPCRMHGRIVEWLNDLGPVRYIVSGSSSHTNQMPQAAVTFPDAKIICAEAADAKCTSVGMRAADYVYTDYSGGQRSNQAAVDELKRFGVRIFHVDGDVTTQSLLVITHDHLFDTDLSCYGNGDRWLHIDQSDWDDPQGPTPTMLTWNTVFYYASRFHCSCVPGYLPDYRVIGMDPSSPTSKLMLDEPKSDGSSCKDMANSLRKLLAMDFLYVDNAHSKKQDSMPAMEFKECVNASWTWLDGKSLLTTRT